MRLRRKQVRDGDADVLAGLASGQLSAEALDASCRRILELVVKSPTFQGTTMGSGVSFTESRKVSEEAAADTMVLLKNQNASLPLASGTTVAVYGNGAAQTVYGGFGAASVTPAQTTSIMEGIRKSKGLSVYQYSKNPFLNCKEHSATDASLDIPVTQAQAVSDAAGSEANRRVNLAQGKPTTSTACEGDYIAANAVDGSTATRWGSLPDGETWFSIIEVMLYGAS